MRLLDLVGQSFGSWLVLDRAENDAHGNTRWLCRCYCGLCEEEERSVLADHLRSGRSRSCGRKARHRHGHAPKGALSPTYSSWLNMWQRCTNPNAPSWKWYGARGVAVCERWRGFESFLADMGERSPGTTLDRIDANGNYEPGNCRWATPAEQTANRRVSRGSLLAPDERSEK